jgi:hypothetical protein
MKHFYIFLALFIAGCGVPCPKDMPETAPCSITVLKDGKPMADVDVNLFRAGGNGALSIGGKTDGNGVAKITTAWGNYKTNGAPVGVCKVTVDKYFEFPPETVDQEETYTWSDAQGAAYEAKRRAEIDKHRIVPRKFTEMDTTPFSVTVESHTGGELTADIVVLK